MYKTKLMLDHNLQVIIRVRRQVRQAKQLSDSSTDDESDTSENLQRKMESASSETLVLITNTAPVVNVDIGMHAS